MNTEAAAGYAEPKRKRPRVEGTNEAKGEAEDASECATEPKNVKSTTPAYGSQPYWEDRYKTKQPGDQTSKNEDDPEPYHAWYFTFEDLAPLLLPLILGSENDGTDDEEKEDKGTEDPKEEEGEEEGEDDETPSQNGDQPKPAPKQQNENFGDGEKIKHEDPSEEEIEPCKETEEEGESEDESDEEVEGFEVAEEVEDGEEEDPVIRVGLAKNGPISVLEVGCGDAPLGRDLALSIREYGSTSGRNPSTIVENVVCMDYSKNVIESMKEEQEKQQQEQQTQTKSEETGPKLLYVAADARQLSYRNETFEMILEKGTLDAMLSDSDGSGQANCRKIVSECGRVLKVGGYIVIISHLNARVESGLRWLNDVIVPGLRATGNFEWLVEVHGSDVEIPSNDEDGTEEGNRCIESPGPAVYFIEKVGTIEPTNNNDGSEGSPPTIPLKFFSY